MTTQTTTTSSTARAPGLVGQIVVVIGGSAGCPRSRPVSPSSLRRSGSI